MSWLARLFKSLMWSPVLVPLKSELTACGASHRRRIAIGIQKPWYLTNQLAQPEFDQATFRLESIASDQESLSEILILRLSCLFHLLLCLIYLLDSKCLCCFHSTVSTQFRSPVLGLFGWKQDNPAKAILKSAFQERSMHMWNESLKFDDSHYLPILEGSCTRLHSERCMGWGLFPAKL